MKKIFTLMALVGAMGVQMQAAEPTTYKMETAGFFEYFGDVAYGDNTFATKVSFTDDGKVIISNPLPQSGVGGELIGKIVGNKATITATAASGNMQWQGQTHFNTGVAIEEGRTYDFSITLTPSVNLEGVTVKPHPEGDDNHKFSDDRHNLVANQDNVITYTGFNSNFSTKNLVITLDFPGAAAGTVIDVKNIIIQENQTTQLPDVNSSDNLMNAGELALASFWWADNNWSRVDDPSLAIDGNNATIIVAAPSGGNQWQGQAHFNSGVAITEGVTYGFYITLKPSADLEGVTVKPHPEGDDDLMFAVARHKLFANKDNVIAYTGCTANFSTNNLVITLDFPGAAAGTVIEVKDIIICAGNPEVNWVDVDSNDNLMTAGSLAPASFWWADDYWVQVADPAVKLVGNKVNFTLPQYLGKFVDMSYGQEFEAYANILTLYETTDGYLNYWIDAEGEQTLEMTINEDGSFGFNFEDMIDPDLDFMSKILGLTCSTETKDEYGWLYYGDWKQIYSKFDLQPLTLPAGVKVEEWGMRYDNDNRRVNVGIQGRDIYIGNLCDVCPDSYVKGTIGQDGKVTVPITYLGIDEEYGYILYFVPGSWEEYYFEEYDETFEDYVIAEEFVFEYDPADHTLTSVDEFSACFISMSDKVGELVGSYYDIFEEPYLYKLNPEDADAPLEAPELLIAYNFRDWYGCDIVEFYIPNLNSKGYILDTQNIYYNFFIDGQLLVLTPEVYIGLEENMVNIPYDFCDYNNEDVFSYGQEKQISVYSESYSTVGVRYYYTTADGKLLESDYVEADIEELSEGEIEGVQAVTFHEVESIAYYDLMGRSITAGTPQHGIYVRVVRYSDGKTRTDKVAIR